MHTQAWKAEKKTGIQVVTIVWHIRERARMRRKPSFAPRCQNWKEESHARQSPYQVYMVTREVQMGIVFQEANGLHGVGMG